MMSCRFCGIICKDSEKAWLKCENVHTASKCRTKYYQNEFWTSIGRVGVRDNRRNEIPMEIVDQNDSVITDSNTVFDKWKSDFCGRR